MLEIVCEKQLEHRIRKTVDITIQKYKEDLTKFGITDLQFDRIEERGIREPNINVKDADGMYDPECKYAFDIYYTVVE